MFIVRNGNKFNVVNEVNSVNQKTLLESVDLETARQFMAQNNDDECFSRDYTKDVYDRGNWDLWGNYVGYKPKQKTLSVSESILDTWEILPRP